MLLRMRHYASSTHICVWGFLEERESLRPGSVSPALLASHWARTHMCCLRGSTCEENRSKGKAMCVLQRGKRARAVCSVQFSSARGAASNEATGQRKRLLTKQGAVDVTVSKQARKLACGAQIFGSAIFWCKHRNTKRLSKVGAHPDAASDS